MPPMITERPGAVRISAAAAARGFGGAGNGDADVGLLQRQRVVDAVAGHADDVAALLQRLDDGVLVLRKHLREAFRPLDVGGDLRRDVPLGQVAGEQVGRPLDVGPEAELGGDLLGDGDVVAGDHLDRDSVFDGARDRLLGVRPWRIEQRQDVEERPGALLVGACDADGPVAFGGELVDDLVRLRQIVALDLAQLADDDLRRALGDAERLARLLHDRRLGALAHRIEGNVLRLSVGVQHGFVLQAGHHREVDRVLIRLPRRERGGEDHRLCIASPRAAPRRA